ncbi:MAG: Unknown protein [uncultured Sulfurovum sp.]|uniref:Uncharacterized protein n=1 Tax=uncultured Sulfurovum sp. TaxID=269237 RepID=A0A6S6TY57_9BACT|nr:MAG: Unknown protein [uncultured Sulfurovum sp.]
MKQWLEYCDKNAIKYAKHNVNYWEKKLQTRLTIDQQEAIYEAIGKKWKDFYMKEKKESKYHKLLGQSLMMDKDCDTLLDIAYKNKHYIYQFKNIRVTTTEPPLKLFKRYGYHREEVKIAPIASVVKDKIFGLINRF